MATTAEQFKTIMTATEFETSVREFIGFPDTREKRFTLNTLPKFMKHEAPYYAASQMTLGEWWDAFSEELSARQCV